MLCHSRYTGPESIIFNEKTRCVKAIKGNVRDTTNLILVPNEVECTEKDFEITRKKYWTKGVCEQKDIIDIHNVVQIKNAMQYNYIYCNLFNITLFNRNISCPPEVFVIPSNQSFKIGDIQYDSQQLNLHSELRFVPDWSYSINHMIDAHMRENIFNDYFSKLNVSINSLNTKHFEGNIQEITNVHAYGNAFLLTIIIILTIIFIYIIMKYKICLKSRAVTEVYNDLEFQSLKLNEGESIGTDDTVVKAKERKINKTHKSSK